MPDTSRSHIYHAATWGLMYALFMQTEPGKTLSRSHTWLSVVIGVGVDLLIAMPVVPRKPLKQVTEIIIASSIGIITRSFINNLMDTLRAERINASYS